MARSILKQINLKLAVLLLSCWVPVLNASVARAQDQCSEAQINANIAKLKDGNNSSDFITSPAFNAVVECESKSIQPLIEIIRNKKANAEVRRKATGALGSIGKGSESALQALIAVVADKQDHVLVRSVAASALERIGKDSESALKALIAL